MRLPTWIKSFGVQVTLALIAGVVLGLIARTMGPISEDTDNWLGQTLDTIGSSYVTLLKAAVVPLIITAIIASIGNLRRVTNAARLAVSTLLWFALTALIAVIIGLILGVVMQPGAHADAASLTGQAPSQEGSWIAFLTGLIPANVLGLEVSTSPDEAGGLVSEVDFNVLQLIIVSGAIGIAAVKVGKAAEPFLEFVEAALAVVQKVVWWIVRIAPIGTLGLIGNAVNSYGWSTMGSLMWFVVAVYVGLAIVFFVVYPTLAKLNGLSVRQYFSGIWPAAQLGFVSRSSIGTMPVTQKVTTDNFGVPSGYAAFAVPFGATTKMDGCAAIYPAIAAVFVAQFFGIDLGPVQYFLIVFVSVIGSAATAGTTGATVMLTLTLSTLGLPLEGVGLLLAIEPIVDMGRTALNVSGQALVPAIVAKRHGILDVERYHARRIDGYVPVEEPGSAEAVAVDADDAARVPDDSDVRQPTR
ncbi:Na+/H+-dicarboxylate symporter [Brevibacterium sanguinis]|uniref:Na+/H+-dicarboxylate symporter n=2 Tax=Brevibacterium TaxID=1696 RepID=A0A366IH57_9MICO|nr:MULTISPECIES: dicarboxylate/amino acid:cation symporter [Brevibacterium]RBP61615.1 Na+/H+-dicarboxylate symporter [Brevibacterium sanguinis]RBP70867.1 Na+/H+-dicarboxylate symporter [Brevibacterium celere]